jgi:hypothetical protein
MTKRFEYGQCAVKDLGVRKALARNGQTVVQDITINGMPVRPSKRFWTSLQVRFGFSANVFKYFTHEEVFQRISQVASSDKLRWCVERHPDGSGTALAVTNPRSGVIRHDDLQGLLRRYQAEGISYSNGYVRSTHTPRLGGAFRIAGDDFQNKFIIDTPIDGFGRPAAYLAMLRMVCTNGAVGYSKTFRSEMNVGRADDGVQFALVRALEGFNNEEGFAALRQRFESAASSWASVNEANKLYKTLLRLHHRAQVFGNAPMPAVGGDGAAEAGKNTPVLRAFTKMTGDLTQMYGLANLDALSIKRQRTLPAACKVYDLLNFASEVATHHAGADGGRTLQAFLGDMLSNEYDLEGTAEHLSDWRDFFIAHKPTTTTLADLNSNTRR